MDNEENNKGWEVSLPDVHGEYHAHTAMMSYKEALDHVVERYGADARGRVSLINQVDPNATDGPSPTESLVRIAIDAILAQKNWGDSFSEEARQVWAETAARLGEAVRKEGYGELLDRALRELEEENERHKKQLAALLEDADED